MNYYIKINTRDELRRIGGNDILCFAGLALPGYYHDNGKTIWQVGYTQNNETTIWSDFRDKTFLSLDEYHLLKNLSRKK